MTTPKPPSQTGCVWVENCIETCSGDTVYVEDEGVRATFANPRNKGIRKIHYDGCYHTGKGQQADFIVGIPKIVDVIVELKNSDNNLKDAAQQVEATLEQWKKDKKSARTIAALIVYGRIEGKKKLPGRGIRANAVKSGLIVSFLRLHGILLRIGENGERQYKFNDFLKRSKA